MPHRTQLGLGRGRDADARHGGDNFVINGSKMFITNGSVGDVYVVMAVTDPEKGRAGVSAFIVERGTAGLPTASESRSWAFARRTPPR